MYIILSGVANVHIRNTTTFKKLVEQVSHSRGLAHRATSAFAALRPASVNNVQGTPQELAEQHTHHEVLIVCSASAHHISMSTRDIYQYGVQPYPY